MGDEEKSEEPKKIRKRVNAYRLKQKKPKKKVEVDEKMVN